MRSSLVAITCLILLAVSYQNCAGHSSHVRAKGTAPSTGSAPLSACETELKKAYETTYYPLLRTIGCGSCHSPNSMKEDSPFSSPDLSEAFGAFKLIGPDRVQFRILTEGHNKQTLQYDNTSQSLKDKLSSGAARWHEIERSCNLGARSAETAEVGAPIFDVSKSGANDPDNSVCGVGDPLKTDYKSFQVLTWDLGLVRSDLAGVKIRITVKPYDPIQFGAITCSHQGYEAGNVEVITTKKIMIQNVRILLNGNNYGVNTFMISRYIPVNAAGCKLISAPLDANTTGTCDSSTSTSGGFAVFDSGTNKLSDKWSLGIETIEEVK